MNRSKRQTGFSLIELIMLVVVLSLLGVSLVQMLGQLSRGLSLTNDAQIAAQLAQECREWLLTVRRRSGYAMGSVQDCSALGTFAGQGPAAVVQQAVYTGVGCPSPASCKLFTINATYQSASASQTLMVVNY